ncbi:hypothetical protein RZS08_40045, partial [Arthrospira platensis SPKY1]|nr:hypothetical protein [Arthrospira platensis SPKY1]
MPRRPWLARRPPDPAHRLFPAARDLRLPPRARPASRRRRATADHRPGPTGAPATVPAAAKLAMPASA